MAPAVVVGHSGGGSVACSLVARHPAVVRHAVIYEPPLSAVVPDGAEVIADYRAMSTFGLEVVDGGFGEPAVLVQTAPWPTSSGRCPSSSRCGTASGRSSTTGAYVLDQRHAEPSA